MNEISRMTKEYMEIAMVLKIPTFVVITKIDELSKLKLKVDQTPIYKELRKLLLYQNILKPVLIRSPKNLELYRLELINLYFCPIFAVSSITGEGIELLKAFINMLPYRNAIYQEKELNNGQVF